jgi:penicillin amidase
MPGDTSLYDWIGYIPFEDLPHGVNPQEGFLASANNRSAGPGYPYHISHWFTVPSRYMRILEMLSEREVFDMEYMIQMQGDQNSLWARRIMKACRPVLLEADISGSSLEAFDRIHNWDGGMDGDAIEPSLFEVFCIKLSEAVFLDELGDKHYRALSGTIMEGVMDRILGGQELKWCDDVRTEDVEESFSDLVVPAWNAAVEWLEENCGSDMESWIWSDLHTLRMRHALGSVSLLNRIFKLERGPYPVGGAGHTVCPYPYSRNNLFRVIHGASQRHVYNLLDPDDSRIIIPTGVSGIPASDFFCNQAEMYINNQYVGESFSREKVERNAAYRSTFSPSRH